jgi:hypothetical protein
MTTKIKYTALNRVENYEQVSFGIVEYKPDKSRTFTFEGKINKKLKYHLEQNNMNQKNKKNKKNTVRIYTKKGCTQNTTNADIQARFVKQKGGGYVPL